MDGLAPFWIGKLDLGVIVPSFRSDCVWRMFVFSFLSFGLALGIFYVGLLFLSLLSGPEPVHGLVKIPLGRVDGWPSWAKILLPFIGDGGVVAGELAAGAGCKICRRRPWRMRMEQSVVIGLGGYLVWKFPAGALLTLHLLNSYIYFGRHPFWKYVNVTAQKMLAPLKKIPLRAGKVDFAPVVALVLLFLVAELARDAA